MVVYNVMERITRNFNVMVAQTETKEQAYDFIAKELNQLILEQNIFTGEIINRYFIQEVLV
jgi:hypothetical protein